MREVRDSKEEDNTRPGTQHETGGTDGVRQRYRRTSRLGRRGRRWRWRQMGGVIIAGGTRLDSVDAFDLHALGPLLLSQVRLGLANDSTPAVFLYHGPQLHDYVQLL